MMDQAKEDAGVEAPDGPPRTADRKPAAEPAAATHLRPRRPGPSWNACTNPAFQLAGPKCLQKGGLVMRPSFPAFPVLCVLPVLATLSAQAGELGEMGWTAYRNARFGLTLSYPAAVFEHERSSKAGDGELFASRDAKARLLVGALANTDGHTPGSYQRMIAQTSYPGSKIDYAPTGGTWSVLSGEKDGVMFYEKVMFSCKQQVISSFALIYPVAQRKLYDPIVEVIEDSFRAGENGCS